MDYETYLDLYGTMTRTNVGISMLPLLRQRLYLHLREKIHNGKERLLGEKNKN